MSQLTIYLPDELERELRAAAKRSGQSVSAYIAQLAGRRRVARAWPREFLDTFGGWEGDFDEPEDLPLEARDPL